jgi:hypothetical protein
MLVLDACIFVFPKAAVAGMHARGGLAESGEGEGLGMRTAFAVFSNRPLSDYGRDAAAGQRVLVPRSGAWGGLGYTMQEAPHYQSAL